MSAAIPVIQQLEGRRMLSTSTVQSVPFLLDFSSDKGEIIDKDGQGTGFTRLQANKNGDQYQANLIDLDTNAGTLTLTTQGSGSNSTTDNNLYNALETQFDGTTSGFSITSRIKGPLTALNAKYNQGGIYFGPDQDNFVKLVAIYGNSGAVLQFKDELGAGNGTLPSGVQNVNIGSFASINTLDLRLVGDPSNGKVSAYYAVNGGAYTKLSSDLTLSGANKSAFFNAASRTGIVAFTRNTSSIDVAFDSFEIKSGTPTTGKPYISDIRPRNGATAVARDGFVAADIVLPTAGAGVDASTLSGNVLLYRTSDHAVIAGVVNTSGGGDALVFTPTSLLDALTSYTFEIKSGLKDTSGAAFLPFTSTFTTGTAGGTVDPNIAFEKVTLSNASAGSYTCVLKGPDGKLYASTVDGLIQRFDINPDGTLSNPQTIKTIQTNNGNKARTITGFTFDPSSTANNLIMWVSNSDGKLTNASDWSGKLTKLTGENLQTYQDVIVGLPRSVRDHINNQPVFGPDGKLYFVQPSNTAMGAPDNAWGLRPEHLLNAAVLQLDLTKLPGTLPVNVQTENVTTPYDPFDANAPLTIYASGIRNAYDLLWADNGHLYAPTNGSAANGATPASPSPAISSTRIDQGIHGDYNGPVVPGIAQVTQTEHDWLFDVAQNGYYGHPNPKRFEWVLNGGNPTSGVDNYEVPQYPVGTQPDRNYRGVAFDFGQNYSPNGVIQYSGGAFGGALDGKILIVRYSGGDDIITLAPAGDGSIASAQTGIAGFKGFIDPVDLTEDTDTGFLYVAEYGGQKITLLKPIAAGANIQISKDKLYFNDIATGNTGGTGASPTQSIRIRNTGSSALAFPSDVLSITGADASSFNVTNADNLTTIQPGGYFDLKLAFTAASTGIKSATLTIKSNDPDASSITVGLRGLGTIGTGGSNEPSLQRILDLYQIPITVGDNNAGDTTFPVPPQAGNDEIAMPRLVKAGDGNVSVELLGVFANAKTPAIRFGYYDPGTPTVKTETFIVPSANDSQTVAPTTEGNTSFDPGEGSFGIYGTFPAFTNREVYSEDALNTWESTTANRRKVRFYPLKDVGGNTVPNAYVFAFEEYTLSYDQNDIVGIIRNVKPADDGPEIGLQNMDGQPFADRMVFNRIENLDSLIPNVVHDTASLLIRNTGNQTLNISSLVLNGGWSFVSGGNATSISPGSTTTVKLKFTGVGSGVKSQLNGSLVINSDDPDEPATTITLAGFWQSYSEQTPSNKYAEPTLVEFMKVFGYGTSVLFTGQNMNTGGKPIKVGEEVLSGYWQRADVNAPVSVQMLAALHKQSATDLLTGDLVNTNSSVKWFYQGSTTYTSLFKHNQTEGQSFFPHLDNSTTQMAAGTFAPNSNAFGFKVDSRYSDDALNPLDLDLNDPTFTTTIPGTGHAFRFYPLKDRDGKLIANTYLMTQDYTGISYANYDYQDNIYLVSNVMPVSPPSAPSSLAASSSGAGITVSWAANSEGNVVGYRIYRSDSANGTYAMLSSEMVTSLRHTDVTAPAGQASYYRVTAVDANGNESAYAAASGSRDADATPPAGPSGVTAIGNPTGITISWSDNLEVDVAGYNVYYAATENGTYTKLNTGGLLTTPTFTDTGAPGNVTSFYQITAVDSSGNESTYTAISALRPIIGKNGNASDMKFDSSGVLHFTWYDSGTKTLKYAERDTDGTWANIQTIDTSGNDVGSYVSLALSSTGKPAVAYFDATNGDLRYAGYNGASWDITTVDSKQSVGLYPSLVFDKAGRPTIAYYRKTSGDLRLAVLKGSWTINDLDTNNDSGRSVVLVKKGDGYVAAAYENTTTGFLKFAEQSAKGWSFATIDATTLGVSFISLGFDPANRASVSYYDAHPGNLKYGAKKNGKWNLNTVAKSGAVGLYTKLLFNSNGTANIFYYDRTKDVLMQATGTLGAFSTTQLESAGGKYANADASPTSGKISYTFYDNATKGLLFDAVS